MVRARTIGAGPGVAVVALTISSVIGCGPGPITSARIEGAVAPTFANLVQAQVAQLGLPPTAASAFGVRANCRKLAGGTSGAGDWMCALTWHGAQRQTLSDTYDVFVATDGCYTATVDGEQLGPPILQTRGGVDIRNLLFVFDGCFDTT
jgi:hypothetical protein